MKLPVKILVIAALVGLIILGAAAGYMVIHRLRHPAAEPQRVEILSVDEERQTLTARDKQTGRVFSVHFGESKDGISVQTGPGVAAAIPSWVPLYPGSSPQGGYAASGSESLSGAHHFKIADSSEKVAGFYVEQLKKLGMRVTEGAAHSRVIGEDAGGKRYVTVNVTAAGGESVVTITYAEKK
jgi:hypothetical protein